MKQIINQNQIVIARESRGYNQYEFAELAGLSAAHLSKMEQGLVEIYEEYIDTFADKLSYPKSFFYQEYALIQPILNHRRRIVVAQKLLTQIDAQINIFCMHIIQMLGGKQLNSKPLPSFDIAQFETPYGCAKELRNYWKLKDLVIDNMMVLIESHGIIIVSFNFGTDRVDSRTVILPCGQAVIFVNKLLLGDRLRFTLAFELGHIIMHLGIAPILSRDISSEANKFAAEFLMPETAIRKDMKDGLSYDVLGELKLKYGVSMQSLVYRADDLEIITDNQKRYLIQQFNALKIRKREPQEYDVQKEQPNLLRNLLAQYKDNQNASAAKMAEKLHIQPQEYVQMYS
jgi:Zn-dependent peptidase ImmA (M78 family)/DNA-binding XRE family transcriptional regulator